MEVFLLMAIGAGLVTAVGSHVVGRRSRANAWLEAARTAGLDAAVLHSRAGWPRHVEGRRGALQVRILSFHDREANRAATRIEIRGLTRGLAFKASAGAEARSDDIQLGDGMFDSEIVVGGDERVAAALLDFRTREMIRDLCAHRIRGKKRDIVIDMGARLDRGCLVSERTLGDQPVWLAGYLGELLDLAERLQEPANVVDRLIANVRSDKDAGVRRTNLLLLLERPASADARRTAIAAGLDDMDEDVRLEAALAAGDEGRPALLEIATHEGAGDACAARAVAALGSVLTAEQARAIVIRAADTGRIRTAEACLESLGRRGPEEAETIGRVLGAADGRLAAAAARSLAAVGSAPSIVLLREAEERLPRDHVLKQAVAEAVAAIRARLVGAGEGQVSLAGNDSGHVSLAGEEEGRVSLAPPLEPPERRS